MKSICLVCELGANIEANIPYPVLGLSYQTDEWAAKKVLFKEGSPNHGFIYWKTLIRTEFSAVIPQIHFWLFEIDPLAQYTRTVFSQCILIMKGTTKCAVSPLTPSFPVSYFAKVRLR